MIFYDQTARALTLSGADKMSLYSAIETNKTLARQEIGRQEVSRIGGIAANQMSALDLALKLKPDVIFLLTQLCHSTTDK